MLSNNHKQISMTAQVIPVRIREPVQIEWMDLTAAAHQDLLEYNVKQVTVAKLMYFPSYFRVLDSYITLNWPIIFTKNRKSGRCMQRLSTQKKKIQQEPSP